MPNSTCDRVFPGRTGPRAGAVSGSSRATLRRPDLRAAVERAQEEEGKEGGGGGGSLVCTSTLVPSEAQSVTVVVRSEIIVLVP